MLQLETKELVSTKPLAYSTAVVIIPGSVNYYYNVEGRRIAEALRELGCEASISTLDSFERRNYDFCFLLSLYEINHACGDHQAFLQQIRELKSCCKRMFPVLLEAVETNWFNHSLQLSLASELDCLLDIGFHNQHERTSGDAARIYRFFFNGLTVCEKRAARSLIPQERPIPWVVVGQGTAERVELVDDLVRNFDSRGFVYLPRHVPYGESGPHLNESQLQSVLERARLKVWCSHHPFPYLESIRFRLALMAGCVPIKVSVSRSQETAGAAFQSFVFSRQTLAEQLRNLDFEVVRQKFEDEFLSLPSFEQSLLELLAKESA